MNKEKQIAYEISKESIDKIFPKKDIDILGYESPIQTIIGQMRMEYENGVYKAIQEQGVNVDKDELIKALRYDRNQYDKGYINGYNRGASEVAEEIFEEIENALELLRRCVEEGRKNDSIKYQQLHDGRILSIEAIKYFIAELKKKYTEEGK